MKTSAGGGRRALLLLVTVFLAWFLSYWAARILLKHQEMETWLRVTVALLPVPFFGLFLVVFVRDLSRLDELQRRIQLEALAIAFPLAVLLLMTLGLLQRAIELPFEDWSYAHVWIYLLFFYCIGLGIATRRYQ